MQQTAKARAAAPSDAAEHRVHIEPSPRRVRVVFNGETVADTKQPLLVLETGHRPVYYFPAQDVRLASLARSDRRTHCPYKGEASYWSLRVGDRAATDAVWGYERPIAAAAALAGHVAFYWDRVDRWLEEDEEIFGHPRDPYHRVDVVNSARPVRVLLGGETVAETRRARFVFETGMATRYYIPPEDVRRDLLTPSATRTVCPYKGKASYWSATVRGETYQDIVWGYPAPVPECPRIAGHFCFFNERAEAILVDGEPAPIAQPAGPAR